MMLRHRIEKQLRDHADSTAVCTDDCSFTYAELGLFASRVARVIRLTATRMTECGPNVGLLFGQGADSIAAVIGGVLSGYAYVPTHADLPIDRIIYMLTHARVKLVVTSSKHAALADRIRARFAVEIVFTDGVHFIPGDLDLLPLPVTVGHQYLVYTSGSTGRPKAVEQTGAGIVYYADSLRQRIGLAPSDRLLTFAHFAFDAAVVDIFSAMLSGAALHPYVLTSPSGITALPDYIVREGITIWHSVPSLFRLFLSSLANDREFPEVRVVLLGGEPVREADVVESRKRFPNATFGSIYGQTESSISSLWLAPPGEGEIRVSLGDPPLLTRLLVAGDDGELVEPLGVGQLVVACQHVASSYWGEPELTREAFSEDPTVGRLYWTGDLGRLLPDGRIEFAGRRDHQVKLRGMRIELEEIEKCLCEHPSVATAVAACVYVGSEPESLACYWEVRPGFRLDEDDVRLHLAKFLPDYMVPRHFLEMGTWPRNANGKIDRKALPVVAAANALVPAESEVEERILEIWRSVLGSPAVGVHTNFFDAGGNSLKLLQVQSLYADCAGEVVPLARFFEFPTISGFAAFVGGNDHKGRTWEPKAPVKSNRLQDRQKRLQRK